jgi:hypothetical protein
MLLQVFYQLLQKIGYLSIYLFVTLLQIMFLYL